MKIKVEKFLMKQGNRAGKAAIEFDSNDGPLAGFHLLGFTICDDTEKGMFVLFPASINPRKEGDNSEKSRPFFFLRPNGPETLDRLENEILDIYESMDKGTFNRPRYKTAEQKTA